MAAAVERAAARNCHVRRQVDRDQTLKVAQVEGPHLGVLALRRVIGGEAAFEAQLDVLEAVERRVGHHHESLARHDDDVALARGAHRVVEGLPVLKRGGRVVGATGHRTVISNGELAGARQRPQEGEEHSHGLGSQCTKSECKLCARDGGAAAPRNAVGGSPRRLRAFAALINSRRRRVFGPSHKSVRATELRGQREVGVLWSSCIGSGDRHNGSVGLLLS